MHKAFYGTYPNQICVLDGERIDGWKDRETVAMIRWRQATGVGSSAVYVRLVESESKAVELLAGIRQYHNLHEAWLLRLIDADFPSDKSYQLVTED